MKEPRTIAALFVQSKGCYANLPNVDPWDEARDAKKYAGPYPVVAHPPCSRWCQLAHMNQARYGHKVGDDGGAFESALKSVRTWGGVLEHPAYSIAFNRFKILSDVNPPSKGGWMFTECGGAVCHVEQGRYGHAARKKTWLYAYGCNDSLPQLKWGEGPTPMALTSFCKNHVRADETRRRLSKKEASATPWAFRDVLISLARSSKV